MIQFPGLIIDLGYASDFTIIFTRFDLVFILFSWIFLSILSELRKIRKGLFLFRKKD